MNNKLHDLKRNIIRSKKVKQFIDKYYKNLSTTVDFPKNDVKFIAEAAEGLLNLSKRTAAAGQIFSKIENAINALG